MIFHISFDTHIDILKRICSLSQDGGTLDDAQGGGTIDDVQ